MKSNYRLSILIPTYNRCSNLRLLLEALCIELEPVITSVGLLVSDNCSTDETTLVTSEFRQRIPHLRLVRHPVNIGGDENFISCIEGDSSDYFWLMGDDDLPRAGVLKHILDLINSESPDLIYLQSVWSREVKNNQSHNPLTKLDFLTLTKIEFARRVNVWVTFISGLIVKRATFVAHASANDLRKYNQTYLVQLAWVLGTMVQGSKFLYVSQPCVLATAGNSGGYAILSIFAETFPSIVNEQFQRNPEIAGAVILRSTLGHLPAIVWASRRSKLGHFTKEQSSTSTIRKSNVGLLGFYVVRIIGTGPMPIALCMRICLALAAGGLRLLDRSREAYARLVR